jgi:hypothetical protein
LNRWILNRIRRKGKAPGLGFDALVLTTIGRKSGVERHRSGSRRPVARSP